MDAHVVLSAALAGKVATYVLVLARVSGFMAVAPLFSARFLPARVKAVVAMTIAFVGVVSLKDGAAGIAGAGISVVDVGAEVVFGLLLGASARATLEAALALGSLFSGQLGFQFAATVDPHAGHQSDVVSDLISMMTLAMAVALDLHREAIVLLISTLHALPPGADIDNAAVAGVVVEHMVASCALAARLSFPLLTMTTAGYVVMGFLGKGAPVLGVQGLGFTIPIVAGGFALYALAPTAAEIVARATVQALHSLGS